MSYSARDWFGRLVLFDDAVQTLEALRPRFKLGLVTNGPSRTQRPKIEQFQLIDYFDLLIVSEEVGVAKPDPTIFAIALERLGVAPSEALFVGDSPEFDLRRRGSGGDAVHLDEPARREIARRCRAADRGDRAADRVAAAAGWLVSGLKQLAARGTTLLFAAPEIGREPTRTNVDTSHGIALVSLLPRPCRDIPDSGVDRARWRHGCYS